ncbi:MAG: hypothetical protein IPH54_15505 [Rhodoferax sp.]|nr:hypothetical protein [Rhodoferax sp.]
MMRDKEGHEGGTSRRLRQALDISSKLFDKRADHLAAAADRPNWPRGDDAKRYPKFEAVHFTKDPELIHPLSGERLSLGPLHLDIGVDSIKQVSQSHFESLIQDDDEKRGKNCARPFWPSGVLAQRRANMQTSLAYSGICCQPTRARPTTASGLTWIRCLLSTPHWRATKPARTSPRCWS